MKNLCPNKEPDCRNLRECGHRRAFPEILFQKKKKISKYEERKPNKMQQLDVYYYILSQHASGIIMPIFRRTKNPLLHLVYCSASAGCGW